MTIAEVGKIYGLSPDTLRYYERIGLLPPVNRNSSGNRDFTEKDCNWVNFIKCMRRAGLSIEVLIEYVSMFQEGESTIVTRKALLKEQRDKLAERITEMQKTLSYLEQKIDRYEEGVFKFEETLRR